MVINFRGKNKKPERRTNQHTPVAFLRGGLLINCVVDKLFSELYRIADTDILL